MSDSGATGTYNTAEPESDAARQTRTLIMAVPWVMQRAKAAHELQLATGGEIVWDTDQHAFHTWRDVLRRAEDGPVVVLQDDVILTDNWRDKIEAVIAEHPGDVIQFFSLRRNDDELGSRYLPGRSYLMNQCYYLPVGMPGSLLEFVRNWETEHPELSTGDDSAMAAYLRANRLRYWLHVPSLVQHRTWTSEINSRRPRNRQSRTFEERS